MHFDPILFLIMVCGCGIAAAGARLVLGIMEGRDGQRDEIKQLTGERIPALPLPRSGPYRDSGDGDSSSEQTEGPPPMDQAERFRRFVYVCTRFKGHADDASIRELAEALSVELLIDVLEEAGPGTPRAEAVRRALSIRTNPNDIPVLLDLLFESEWTHVPETVLHILHDRGPVNEDVISAVYDLVYAEPDEDEDEDDESLRRLAGGILDKWEAEHPDRIKRFALLK
jgi:hypothetical protein